MVYQCNIIALILDSVMDEEQLVLMRTKNKDGERAGAKDYVYVDWGPLFASQHDASSTAFGEPELLVGLGPLGLSYILRTGGMGYFKKGVVAQHIEAGDSKPSKARRNHLSAYAVYPEASEGDLTFRKRCAA